MLKDLTYTKDGFEIKNYKRLAIFASFSNNNLITDDIVFYLEKLRDVCDAIAFVADNQIEDEEFAKIKNLVVFAEFKKHGRYDFGSYQRGFFWARDNGLLDKTEEIVFCNDSVCGPYQPIAKIFEKKIADGNPDFYGHTCNDMTILKKSETNEYEYVFEQNGNIHIQSYFLIISKKVFSKDFFIDFMKNIVHLDEKNEIIIQYEIGLSNLIKSNDCSIGAFVGKPTRDFLRIVDEPENYVFCKKCFLSKYQYVIKMNRMLRRYKYPYLYVFKERILPNTFCNYVYSLLFCRKKRFVVKVKHFINKHILGKEK